MIWSLSAAVTIVAAAVFGLSPLLPDIAASFGRSMQQAGALVSGFGASLAFSAPVIGLWGRHWPRVVVMSGGLLVAGLGWTLATQAPTWPLVCLAIALSGCGVGAVLPSAYALAADLSTDQNRGTMTGRVVAGWAVANVIVVPLLAWAGAAVSWRQALLGLAVAAWGLAAVVVAMQWRGRRRDRAMPASSEPAVAPALVPAAGSGGESGADPTAGPSSTWQVLMAVLRHPRLRRLLLANLLDMASYYGMYTYLGAALRAANHWDAGQAGLLMTGYGLGLGLVASQARWLDRLGLERAARLALLVLSVWLALLGQTAASPALAFTGLVLWGLIQGSFFTAVTALTASQLPAHRGVATAMLSCATYLGVMLGAAVLGPVFGVGGFGAVGLGCGAFALAAWGAMRALHHPPKAG